MFFYCYYYLQIIAFCQQIIFSFKSHILTFNHFVFVFYHTRYETDIKSPTDANFVDEDEDTDDDEEIQAPEVIKNAVQVEEQKENVSPAAKTPSPKGKAPEVIKNTVEEEKENATPAPKTPSPKGKDTLVAPKSTGGIVYRLSNKMTFGAVGWVYGVKTGEPKADEATMEDELKVDEATLVDLVPAANISASNVSTSKKSVTFDLDEHTASPAAATTSKKVKPTPVKKKTGKSKAKLAQSEPPQRRSRRFQGLEPTEVPSEDVKASIKKQLFS